MILFYTTNSFIYILALNISSKVAQVKNVNKNVNIAAHQVLYLNVFVDIYMVNLNANSRTIDENIKIEVTTTVFLCKRVHLSILYNILLSQRLAIYCSTTCIINIITMYHNVLFIT